MICPRKSFFFDSHCNFCIPVLGDLLNVHSNDEPFCICISSNSKYRYEISLISTQFRKNGSSTLRRITPQSHSTHLLQTHLEKQHSLICSVNSQNYTWIRSKFLWDSLATQTLGNPPSSMLSGPKRCVQSLLSLEKPKFGNTSPS